MEEVKIKHMLILVKLSDGTVRQVIATRDQLESINYTLTDNEDGRIKVSSEIIHGLSIEENG